MLAQSELNKIKIKIYKTDWWLSLGEWCSLSLAKEGTLLLSIKTERQQVNCIDRPDVAPCCSSASSLGPAESATIAAGWTNRCLFSAGRLPLKAAVKKSKEKAFQLLQSICSLWHIWKAGQILRQTVPIKGSLDEMKNWQLFRLSSLCRKRQLLLL